MWITGFPIQILLHKYKVEQADVCSRLLQTLCWKIYIFLIHFHNLLHNYDATNLENIRPIIF